MKQVLFLVVVTLTVYQTTARGAPKKEDDLERRLRDLTESEQPLALEREACSVQFVKVGCFKDTGSKKNKVLNQLLFTDRDRSDDKSSGKLIDWRNFGSYIDDLTCRCAQKAKKLGYTHFGTQYYGECLSAPDAGRIYNRDGSSRKCVNQYYQKCSPDDAQVCVGQAHANFIYKIPEEGSGGGELGAY